MEIEVKRLPRMSLDGFADKYGLTMVVRERSHKPGPIRFYAAFDGVDVMDGIFRCGQYGNGATEDEAIENYIPEISGKVIVRGFGENREEIVVPIITGRKVGCLTSNP